MAYPSDPVAEAFATHARRMVLLASEIETAAALRVAFGALGDAPITQASVDDMADAEAQLRDILDLCAGAGTADALFDQPG